MNYKCHARQACTECAWEPYFFQFFKILSILLIAAHTLAQTKYLCDCDMSVFCCHEAVLAGNIRVQIFLMAVELFFLFSCEFRVP